MTALAVILLVASACAERPDAPAAVDRLVEENHKAAEALVQAAREAAAAAGEQAHDAATQILRYFELSLPNHHADEEEDVFPALRGLNDVALAGAIAALEAEHAVLDALWQEAAPWLRAVAQGEACAAPETLAQFVAAYAVHTEREEREVFSAIDRLPASTVDAIAQRMRARRGG